MSVRPATRKYPCRECTLRSGGAVREAAVSAWASTWPPNTRCSAVVGCRARNSPISISSRSSRSVSSATDCGMDASLTSGAALLARGGAPLPRRGSQGLLVLFAVGEEALELGGDLLGGRHALLLGLE